MTNRFGHYRWIVAVLVAIFALFACIALRAQEVSPQQTQTLDEQIRQRRREIEKVAAEKENLKHLCDGRTGTDKKACEQIKKERELTAKLHEESLEQATREVGKANQKVIETQIKIIDAKDDERDRISEAQISGCTDEEVGRIQIHPIASKYSSWYGQTLVVRVVNESALPVDIESPFKRAGWLVRNLCPRGSLTLSFRLEFSDPDSLQLPLKALSRPGNVEGGLATEEKLFSMYRSPNQRIDNQIWQIHLSRVYQTR